MDPMFGVHLAPYRHPLVQMEYLTTKGNWHN